MTKQDYQFLARFIRQHLVCLPVDQRRTFIDDFIRPLAEVLQENNRAFDANLFLILCGVTA